MINAKWIRHIFSPKDDKKKYGNVSVYYNPKWGYIITSSTTRKDSLLKVVIKPVLTQKADVTVEQLGETILTALENSQKALPVEREEDKALKFWEISGIKNFAAFSKKFKCIKVIEKESALNLVSLKRNSDGAYAWDKNDKGIDIDLNPPCEYIGNLVYTLFHEEATEVPKEEEIVSFQTVNENEVTFNRPSDSFLDIGDGHTDAYQIYTYENDEKSLIAFFIDNGYEEISKPEIKRRWTQIYGTLKEYSYEEVDKDLLKLVVCAATDKLSIKSYFYQDGEDLLEVLTEVSTNVSEEQRLEIEKEIENVIKSIKIDSVKTEPINIESTGKERNKSRRSLPDFKWAKRIFLPKGDKKKYGRVSVYYNPEWGYIIASETNIKDSLMDVIMNPVMTEKIDVTVEQLGETVLTALEKSRKALPVAEEDIKDFKFWQISGIKNFAVFSKKFKCIEVTEKEHGLHLVRLKRDSYGAYGWDENDEGIDTDLDPSCKYIGNLVCTLFYEEEYGEEINR